MAEGGGGEDGPAKAEEPEVPIWKKCCFAMLDVCAMIVRTILAIVHGITWCCQRSAYPIKETILACCDSINRWLHPYLKKAPAATDIPVFVDQYSVVKKTSPGFQF
mmetsp:Transcript_84977/g.147421  ORF Transcript_84977/g.147421 Transcript_84977/m.147421 type:complete len:106 (-) Transcript_84977:65-382(-)